MHLLDSLTTIHIVKSNSKASLDHNKETHNFIVRQFYSGRYISFVHNCWESTKNHRNFRMKQKKKGEGDKIRHARSKSQMSFFTTEEQRKEGHSLVRVTSVT